MSWYKNWLIWVIPAPLLCAFGLLGTAALGRWLQLPVIEYLVIAVFSTGFLFMAIELAWLTWKDMLSFRGVGMWRYQAFRSFARWWGFTVALVVIVIAIIGLWGGLYNIWKIIVER